MRPSIEAKNAQRFQEVMYEMDLIKPSTDITKFKSW